MKAVPTTAAEAEHLQQALNDAVMSLHIRMDPVDRAVAAGRVQEVLSSYLAQVSEVRRRAVASAVTLPGMSMASVADELGVSKSMVAKLAGPARVRGEIASQMRSALVSSEDSPSSDERLRAAFELGAAEGRDVR